MATPKASPVVEPDEVVEPAGTPQFTVCESLLGQMKPHQKEGVEFIFKHCFPEWTSNVDERVSGCIIAHHMGTGKSLTAIAMLHTVMNERCIWNGDETSPVRSALVVIPANTVSNWTNEVDKWTAGIEKPLPTCSLRTVEHPFREGRLDKWKAHGGTMIVTPHLFRLHKSAFVSKGGPPDVVVIDEAHTVLNHSSTMVSKALREISTRRRILLTGTPLQNNVTEYFQLVHYVKPDALRNVPNEKEFEKKYRKPIESGLASDAYGHMKKESKKLQGYLHAVFKPFVHRIDQAASEKVQDLPPCFDTLLCFDTNPIQNKILTLYKQSRKEHPERKNFFRMYSTIAPMLNHPGLLPRLEHAEWIKKRLKPGQVTSLHETWRSPKFIVLIHIVVMAVGTLGEKTLVYSKDLKTLDMIEELFQLPKWQEHLKYINIKRYFPEVDKNFGGWKKGQQYLRMDGGTKCGIRGMLVDKFNKQAEHHVFLVSSEAGGIGVNLTSATRVVLMDNHFNPAVSKQCIARAHRYGQTRPVYCYRLAIKGTVESKVHARSVNKSFVSSAVVDGDYKSNKFAREEIEDLSGIVDYITCCKCDRRVELAPDHPRPMDEETWTCNMNNDASKKFCLEAVEEKEPSLNESDDPILNHLVRVIIPNTKRGRLLVSEWERVRESSEGTSTKKRAISSSDEDASSSSDDQETTRKEPRL